MKRDQNIVVKTQFNIGGSRGRHVEPFITDYVTRTGACEPCLAYGPVLEEGDGVTFTLDSLAISREETLALARRAETVFQQKDRAIEQLVLSFRPSYLTEMHLVPDDVSVLFRGDYSGNYDDVRIRHAVTQGMWDLIDREGYTLPQMAAAIQADTRHLHVHAVLWEDSVRIARRYGREERGLLKPSSLAALTHGIDRYLEATNQEVFPTKHRLYARSAEQKPEKKGPSMGVLPLPAPETNRAFWYLELLKQQKQEQEHMKGDLVL